MNTEETVFGWHFLCNDSTRNQDGVRVEQGDVETWEGDLELCESGLHFCVRPLDALRYAQGALIRRVRISGNILQPEDEDKGCATVRTELWRADIRTLLHEFACDVAEQALDQVAAVSGSVDDRSRNAIEAKRQWLRGGASDEELIAAWAAAEAAARAAAWAAAGAAARAAAWAAAGAAARDAAWAAAGAAARDAAWAAAWDAARDAAWDAAWDAARDAAWATMNADLERRLLALPEAREEVSA